MNKKKLQIFVSSTYLDLIEERQAAVEVILQTGNIPAGMELFAAGDESQMKVIKRWIDESDVYMLIIGGRYGSIDPASGKSYTHLEYEYASQQNKALFAVIIRDDALETKNKLIGSTVLEKQNPQALAEFKILVQKNMVEFYSDKKDIQLAVFKALSQFSSRTDLVGWIKGDQAENSGLIAQEIAKLSNANSELRGKIEKTESPDDTLYGDYTFRQLKMILLKYDIGLGNNMFDFFVANGSQILNNKLVGKTDFGEKYRYTALIKFKLVQQTSPEDDKYGAFYGLTESGKMFFLRALEEIENTKGF